VEELTDKAPSYEIGCQTEIKIDRPNPVMRMAVKRGVDKKTLVEDNELFLFDDEVEPILQVLCGKTLEVSRMEVLEEEELREMREQQEHYNRMLLAENTDIKRMEDTEMKRLQDFEKLKSNMREKRKNKQLAHRKVVSRCISKNYVSGIRERVFKNLTDIGFYTDNFKVDVLDNDVVPWLYDKAFEYVADLQVQESLPTNLILDHLVSEEKEHSGMVMAESDRKKAVAEEEYKEQQRKLEEKQKRREAREAKRRAEELAKLRNEIEATFIA